MRSTLLLSLIVMACPIPANAAKNLTYCQQDQQSEEPDGTHIVHSLAFAYEGFGRHGPRHH
jgi:hypothetical protein